MEQIDPVKAAAVWQRVHSTGQPRQDTQELPGLIRETLMNAAAYLQLSRQLSRSQAVLRQLSRQEQSQAACLKGLYLLLTGEQPVFHTPRLTPESTEAALRRCWEREINCLAQYEARSANTQYAMVFSQLAKQKREHCLQLLELLGNLKQHR